MINEGLLTLHLTSYVIVFLFGGVIGAATIWKLYYMKDE